MELDSYLHTHKPVAGQYDSQVNIASLYEGLHLINIHSIYFYNNFKNISASLQNNVFYYEPALNITVPDGNYSVNSFNKYLLSTAASLYRVVNSYDGLSYQVAKYASVNDRANDVNRIIQNVNTSSTLNREIASGIVWCERI